jgi:hypothetical protein
LAALIGSDEPGHGSQVPQALEVADRFTAQDVRQGHVDQNLAAVSEGDLLSVKPLRATMLNPIPEMSAPTGRRAS